MNVTCNKIILNAANVDWLYPKRKLNITNGTLTAKVCYMINVSEVDLNDNETSLQCFLGVFLGRGKAA